MKRVSILFIVLLFLVSAQALMAQQIVRLGDLPLSDFSIEIYQVVGFQEGVEGYRLTYTDQKNEPNYLYLPAGLRDKYEIYKPTLNTYAQNFLILWRKGGSIERIQWYMPTAINYRLPYFAVKEFADQDKKIFEKIVQSGELALGTDIGGLAPEIRAPAGSQ
jgi:hypothetical protein